MMIICPDMLIMIISQLMLIMIINDDLPQLLIYIGFEDSRSAALLELPGHLV